MSHRILVLHRCAKDGDKGNPPNRYACAGARCIVRSRGVLPGIATQDWNQTGMSGRWVIDDPFPAPHWPSNRARWPCTGFPACWNATWCTDCRTVIYKQRRRQHGLGRDRVPRGIRLLGGRPGHQGRRLRLVPLMGSRIRFRSSQGRSFGPVNRRRPCALAHVFVKTPAIPHSTVNEQNVCPLLSPPGLTFGPKTRGFLDERPEFSSVARAETGNFC